ncbi:hypothetical protein [Neorhizobium sp. T25_13]|uniref:hypothetical protein n=1 Tax=Neorhizobium sp. T25_13 TaxID=2093830 RepID=UPI000CF850A3|nr:hypothetical protein [Neorhizobium sp. T25_13]
MRILLISAFLFLTATIADAEEYKIISPYQGIQNKIKSIYRHEEGATLKICGRFKSEDNGCLGDLFTIAQKYIQVDDLKGARRIAQYLKKYNEESYPGMPCFEEGRGYEKSGYGIWWEYNALVYYLDKRDDSPAAKNSGMRAFLCQAGGTRDPHNFTSEPLDAKEFAKFLRPYYGESPQYDGERFMTEIMDVLYNVRQSKVIIKDGVTKTDKAKVERLAKEISVYRHAAAQCRKDGYAEEFCSFLDSWRKYYEYAKSRFVKEGEL